MAPRTLLLRVQGPLPSRTPLRVRFALPRAGQARHRTQGGVHNHEKVRNPVEKARAGRGVDSAQTSSRGEGDGANHTHNTHRLPRRSMTCRGEGAGQAHGTTHTSTTRIVRVQQPTEAGARAGAVLHRWVQGGGCMGWGENARRVARRGWTTATHPRLPVLLHVFSAAHINTRQKNEGQRGGVGRGEVPGGGGGGGRGQQLPAPRFSFGVVSSLRIRPKAEPTILSFLDADGPGGR